MMKKKLLVVVALLNALSICRITPATKTQPAANAKDRKVIARQPGKGKSRSLKTQVRIKSIKGAENVFDEIAITGGKQISVNAILAGESVGFAQLADGDSKCTLYQGKPLRRANKQTNKTAPGKKPEVTNAEVQKIEIGTLEFSAPLKLENFKKQNSTTNQKTLDITATFTPKALNTTTTSSTTASTSTTATPSTPTKNSRTVK